MAFCTNCGGAVDTGESKRPISFERFPKARQTSRIHISGERTSGVTRSL